MRNLSILMFGIALVLASITVFFARSFINNQRATQVEQTVGPQQEMGTMIVAAMPLQFGDEITVESLKKVPWPLDIETRPEGSFSVMSEILTSERRVAIRSLAKNEPVIQEKISGFGYRATLSQVVDATKRAVAIRVNDVTGVGGFVMPGDRVDVLHTYKAGDELIDTVSNMIIRDVRVLAIDQIADESTEGAVVAKAATLEVSEEQAAKLSLSAKVGSLDLVLRPMLQDNNVLDVRSNTIKVADLTPDNGLKSEPPKALKVRSYKSSIRAAKPVSKSNPFGKMTVTRGIKSQEQKVFMESDLTVLNDGSVISNGYVTELAGPSPSP